MEPDSVVNLWYWMRVQLTLCRMIGPNGVFEYNHFAPANEIRIFYWNDYVGKRTGCLWLLWDTIPASGLTERQPTDQTGRTFK